MATYVAECLFAVAMLIILGLRRFAFAWLMLLPILVCVLFRRAVAASFDRPLANLSLHAAADLDRADLVRFPSHSLD